MLTYDLQKGPVPLYQQLYEHIRSDIESGSIGPSEKLPSKRALAQHLGISVMTVEGAYRQLAAEGYIRSAERSGYFANDVRAFAGRRAARRSQAPAKEAPDVGDAARHPSMAAAIGGKRADGDKVRSGNASSPGAAIVADLTGSGAPAAEAPSPYKAWTRMLRTVVSEESEETMAEVAGDASGSIRLRRAISQHLLDFRGLEVPPERIVVASGAQTLYSLIVQLLGRDRAFAVEDPGYKRAALAYASNGAKVAHVPLDPEGISACALAETAADVVHCTPAHQFPTGTVMSAARRFELLEWASADGLRRSRCSDGSRTRYIIEDDYDCEFRTEGMPIPPLKSIDAGDCVIYMNTFTRSLGSAFRIAYMVLPENLAKRFRDDLGFYSNTVGAITQLTLAKFIESGEYERHTNRRRAYYRRVQQRLVETLRSECGDALGFRNVGAGLHFLMDVDGGSNDQASKIAERSLRRSVRLARLSDYAVDANSLEYGRTFVINLAALDEGEVRYVAETITKSVLNQA